MALTLVRTGAAEAADDVRRAWDRNEPVLVLDPAAPEPERRRLLDRLDPEAEAAPEVAAVVATSGTTGDPRGVELTWSGLLASAEAVSAAVGAGAGDRWLCCLPLHHVGGLAVMARSWATGVPVTVLDHFDADAVEAAVSTGPVGRRPTLVSFVPTMLTRLGAAGVDLGAFRRILVGGAPLAGPLPPQAVATYGLTETWGGVVHGGFPLAGTEVRLADDAEILLRGPTVMRGYRLAPALTATALFDGWLRTGDVGAFDSTGALRIVDRRRDLIITGGVNVSPSEVERVLAEHPSVAEVCVAGAVDPEWGEVVVAHVVPADRARPPDLATLRAFAAGRLSAAKLPREVRLLEAIPRTASGKPLRRLLAIRSSAS